MYNGVSMGYSTAEIRKEDDIRIYQKPFAGVIPKAAQIPGIFRLTEQTGSGLPDPGGIMD